MMWLLLVWVIAMASSAEAACTGSGLVWSCAAGTSSTDINTAISSASDQAVVTLANGSYPFGVSDYIDLSGKNGISVVCATVAGCTINSTGLAFALTNCSAPVTNVVRISGFNLTGTFSYKIWVYCAYDITKLRIDHNDIYDIGASNIAMFIGEGGSATPYPDRGHLYGVIDHNTCRATTYNFTCIKNTTGGDVWTTGTVGSGSALFIEDNVCNFGTRTDFGSGCIDNWRAQSTVARFNTVIGTVLRAHSYCHNGPQSMELYGNDIDTSGVSSSGSWDIHLQGSGENMVWGNTVTAQGGSLASIGLQSYRSDSAELPQGLCTAIADGTHAGVGTPADPLDGNRTPTASYYGYPYWHQPGRDANATLKPVYSYKNITRGSGLVNIFVNSGTWTGLAANCAGNDTDRVNCHIQKDRDVYLETASFTGASGVGVGTLASRPATCAPTPEALDAGNGGVGYWATDQGSWNQSASNPYGVNVSGADGVLYRCSATNTWTTHYTPYTYPHPLQGGVTASSYSGSLSITGSVSVQ